MTTNTNETTDLGDPSEWDEWPDGYGGVIARYLEDEGWHVEASDDTTVNVIASNGTDTGVWFARGRCWTGKGDGHGTCNNPVDILADMSDPEEIAGRADTVMREIGLQPGTWTGPARCTDGCMDDDTLPHDGYIEQVAGALEARGMKPSSWWTETPDGERLDGVLNFDSHPDIDREWPEGICLSWDQQHGWSLIVGRENRWLDPLPVGTYAHPQAVASATFHRLRGEKPSEADDAWDDAAALLAAVEAWEAEGA